MRLIVMSGVVVGVLMGVFGVGIIIGHPAGCSGAVEQNQCPVP